MRLTAIILAVAALGASSPAAAQGWEEYAYPDYAFAVAFPAAPQIETTTHQVADGRSVPARVYSVRQNNVLLKMTIADLTGANLEESTVIGHAMKSLSVQGKVLEDVPHRIYRVYGRHLSVEGADGSHTMASIFNYKGRLYQIEGKVLPGANAAETHFAAVRFEQSLTFTDGGTNRTEDALKAIREGCPGLAGVLNAGGNPVTPAGTDDPRCRPAQ